VDEQQRGCHISVRGCLISVRSQDRVPRREAGRCPGPRRGSAIVSDPRDSVNAVALYASDQAASSRAIDQFVWRCTGTSFCALRRRLRQGLALSREELAGRIRTTQSAIARPESGSATLSKLAEALGENLHVHIYGRIDR
jgi:DNA-binding transcriptional regulator YiaG